MAATSIPRLQFKFGKHSYNIPRYVIIILFVALALFVGYTHRNVVSVTKLAIAAQYDWTQFQESQFVASYYYGYILPQLMIGIACQLWGGKWILAFGLGMSSVFTFVAPFVSSTFWLLIVDRVLTGFFQGAALPATTALYGRWIPREQYSLATGIQYSGMYLGTAFANGIYSSITAATIPGTSKTWGWQGSFYLYGVIGICWLVFFMIFVQSGPEHYDNQETAHMIRHKESNDDENHRAIHGQHFVLNSHKTPTFGFIMRLYGKLLVTIPSIVISNWSMYLLMGYVPSYLVCILGLNTELSALFGFLPYLLLYVVLLISSFVADRLITKKILSKTNVRKLMVAIGFGFPSVCLVGLAFVQSKLGGSFLLVFAIAFSGAAIPGFFPLPLDISRDYSGIIISMSNTLATIAGILAPLTTGVILTGGACQSNISDSQSDTCRTAWRAVLLIAAAVYVFGIIIMSVFGSAEEIDWDAIVEPQRGGESATQLAGEESE
ncbi:hypothetical protein HK096_004009 [Nowakowskiella sp. JEL0078]|nr:hypothetical protein HK096_004009 [Nowakowskiella sp. JEL0078]